jgi:hypothetical protein
MNRYLGACLFLLLAEPAFAATARVDCSGATPGAFTSINAALASLPGTSGHTIRVSGTCVERVTLHEWKDLRLEGAPSATLLHDGHLTEFRILSIRKSENVVLRNLTIGAAAGGAPFTPVQIASSTVSIESCTLQGGTALASGGLWVVDRSSVSLRASAVLDSSPSGIRLDHGQMNLGGSGPDAPNVIERNGAGIRLRGDAEVIIWGNNVIRDNAQGIVSNGGHVFLCCTPGLVISDNVGAGISIALGGTVQANSPVTFENNGFAAIRMVSGSAILNSGQVFRGNGQVGNADSAAIVATGNSHLELANAEITANNAHGVLMEDNSSARIFNNVIQNNAGNGIRLLSLSSARLLNAPTVTGNDVDLFCSSGSLARGDDSGVGRKRCPGFER